MGEFDGLKVKAEDNPFAGMKVNPEDLAPKSKYPQPRSMSKTSEELGLSSGLADPRTPDKDSALSHGTDIAGPELSPVEKQLKGKYEYDKKFLMEAAPWLAGGVAGKAIGGALSAPAIKGGTMLGELSGKAIANTAEHAMHGGVLGFLAGHATGHGLVGALTGIASKPILTVAARHAPAVIGPIATASAGALPHAVTAGVAAGRDMAAGSAEDEPKPYRGVMSNAVERLRAKAATDTRARELLSRIDAAGAGTGTVTQSTGVE